MSYIETDSIEIIDARYFADYKLKLSFNDGKTNIINFEPFLRKAGHPEIKKYLDTDQFKNFTFEYGYIHWNDYDLSFSIEDLHEGQIM
jgi:hypothetical protein